VKQEYFGAWQISGRKAALPSIGMQMVSSVTSGRTEQQLKKALDVV
jgi:hypothetical protein